MTILLLALLGTSHGLAAVPFFRKVRAGLMPATVDFATLSIILYYDTGMVAKWLFPQIVSDYFTPLTEAHDGILTLAVLILFAAPWLFRAGSALADQGDPHDSPGAMPSMSVLNLIMFYGHLCLPSAPLWPTGASSTPEVERGSGSSARG